MRIEAAMTPRLYAIAHSVPQGARLADVGTDHGYIPIYLCLQNRLQSALAMDVRSGPLQRAEENIARYGLKSMIKTRLSNGLAALAPNEADTAVLAGMGGLLIAQLLDEAPFDLDCYILQPMTAVPELRRYLAEHGYAICDEMLAREQEKIYTIMTVRRGTMPWQEPEDALIGRALRQKRDPLLPLLTDKLIAKYEAALSGLKLAHRVDTADKVKEYEMWLSSLRHIKEECKAWSN